MKKITKFLDSVMGGIKRTCVAKALAVFAVASIAINSFAQTPKTTQSVINGVEDFPGLTLEQLEAASTSINFSFADKTKVLFLYNVGTGKFLNVGGYWGTCAGLHDYGKALWVDLDGTNFKFTMNNSNDTGNTLGLLLGDSETDNGVFVDRGNASGEEALTNWTIEAVPNDAHNTVWIYTEKKDGSSYEDAQKIGKYYLSANPKYDGTNKVCDAYKSENGEDLGENGKWRIFTYAQIYKAQQGSVDNMKNALDLSFRLKSPNFERHDGDIKYWKTYDFVSGNKDEDGFAKFGLEKYHTTIAKWDKDDAEGKWDNGYEFDYSTEKKTFADVHDYQRYLGKYFCGSITGKCGILYQDIDITLPGTYVIECKGYSNTTKAKLFTGVLDPNNEKKMVDGTMNSTMFNQVSNMSAEEQKALHTADSNMDYAGRAFYDNLKYMNSVVLTVPESVFTKNPDGTTKPATIRLGVMTGTYSTDASKVEDAAPGEWTVFDDFRLQYASNNTDQDLILDEMRDNLNYLVNGSDKYENATLHLKKKLTKNKWNSLVLPVSLTKNQLQSTFGANTRLAKLNTLTPTSIEFKSVDLDKIGDTDVALVANMPYIIFPEKDQTESNSASYTAIINVNNKTKKVNVSAGHYTIAKVTKVDFSKIDKSNWTTKLTGGDNTIKAYGTFARTFGEYTENDEDGTYSKVTTDPNNPIISGRPTLVNCYFFDKGNMYHSAKRPRGLRGFSCWFQPTTTSGAQNAQLTIDGVSQGTTGIEDILADYEQPVSRFANGVYNMNGQLVKQGNSTAGLPSGMYIVNGKKCIVR